MFPTRARSPRPFVLILATCAACAFNEGLTPTQPGRPGAPGPAPMPKLAVGAPLPSGWVWPVNAQTMKRGLTPGTTYRPVNVAALRATAGSGPCAPFEVAPSIWITPFCGTLPKISLSPRVGPRPLAAATPTATASTVDLRALGLDGPVKDQQQAGVCWSFAISTLMDNALLRAGRRDVMAPLHIVADDELQLLFQNGAGRPLVQETAWPYDPHKACELDDNSIDKPYCREAYNIDAGSWNRDPELVAERSRAEGSGVYRILGAQPLSHNPGNPDEIARVLSTGQAVYVGFDIDVHLWSAENHQADAVIPDWQADAQSGGHAVTLVGYRTVQSGRQFLVHNSWGTGWGDGGYAWVSERMVHDRLNDAFALTVGDSNGTALPTNPSPSPTPGPTPTPSPTPAPSGLPFPFPLPLPGQQQPATACASGQVRDALLQTCVAPCGNGAAPIAGICAVQPQQQQQPTPTPAAGCAAGQRPDLVTQACEPACPSGNPRAAGICLF